MLEHTGNYGTIRPRSFAIKSESPISFPSVKNAITDWTIMHVPLELKLKYLNRRIHDLQCLKSSLEKDDYCFALKLGHQLKGNAVTFDFPDIALIGLEIEVAARAGNKEQVLFLAMRMENSVKCSQEKYGH